HAGLAGRASHHDSPEGPRSISRIAPFADNRSCGGTTAESERDDAHSHNCQKRRLHQFHASMIALNPGLLKTLPLKNFLKRNQLAGTNRRCALAAFNLIERSELLTSQTLELL